MQNGGVADIAGHGLGRTRARVLSRLTDFEGGVGVAALAKDLQLHANTIRFHLDALVSSGYANRQHETPRGQGRPRTLYRATANAPVIDTGHLRDLTQVLVRHLIRNAPDPAAVAEDVGRSWGEEVGEGETNRDERDGGLRGLLDHTLDMGFKVTAPDSETIAFHTCPYRSVAQPTLASICTVHLGMMRGYLESTESDLEVTSLRPGEVCIATLRRRDSRQVAVEIAEPVPRAGDALAQSSAGSEDT